MKHLSSIVISAILTLLWLPVSTTIVAESYSGRVVDEKNIPIGFATVYLQDSPGIGTATNNDGVFTLETDAPKESTLIISFIGYEKALVPLSLFLIESTPDSLLTDTLRQDKQLYLITLKEQPIALEETVVEAKPSKQRNKRKQMAQLLYKVYNRIQFDFPQEPVEYKVVSDVSMSSEQQPWGMEQVIAKIVSLPQQGRDSRDSVQFAAQICKRFFDSRIRSRADLIYQDSTLTKQMRLAATEIDSGVVVHRALWAMGDLRYDFEKTMNDIRHWTVSKESETETVLTHTDKHNYLGIFKYEFKRHYILDSETLSVKRFTEEMVSEINIPFGYKVKGVYLDMLNLLNMDNQTIDKFRLKHAKASAKMNTIYERVDGTICIKEKNLHTQATLIDNKKNEIPIDVKATQRSTSTRTIGITPMTPQQMTRRLKRQVVDIY